MPVESAVEVHLGTQPVGTVYRKAGSGRERIAFRYTDGWLAVREAFALDPELFLDTRTSSPRGDLFGVFADCAPDRWGRRLMQRKERHEAAAEERAVRSLSELDYVLGVSDMWPVRSSGTACRSDEMLLRMTPAAVAANAITARTSSSVALACAGIRARCAECDVRQVAPHLQSVVLEP